MSTQGQDSGEGIEVQISFVGALKVLRHPLCVQWPIRNHGSNSDCKIICAGRMLLPLLSNLSKLSSSLGGLRWGEEVVWTLFKNAIRSLNRPRILYVSATSMTNVKKRGRKKERMVSFPDITETEQVFQAYTRQWTLTIYKTDRLTMDMPQWSSWTMMSKTNVRVDRELSAEPMEREL